jgi:hypothetical protein
VSFAPARSWFQSLAVAKSLTLAWRGSALVLALLLAAPGPRAEGIELTALSLTRSEEGLFLDYSTRFDLPAAVEDALLKGVPIYFVAEAEVFRSRWYWRDQRVARSVRNWRLTWQPLTRRYVLNLGSVSQSYDSVSDALGAVQRASRWKLADPAALGSEAGLYLEFSLRLDTSQLPRPLQISFGGQSDWELRLERTVKLPDAAS